MVPPEFVPRISPFRRETVSGIVSRLNRRLRLYFSLVSDMLSYMGRPLRVQNGGLVYHAMNRSCGRFRLFKKPGDYLAFLRVMAEAQPRTEMRILGFCVMPNHWHMLLWPRRDGDLVEFMRWLSVTHSKRYRAAHNSVGLGHLYGGRYKSFPVEQDQPTADMRSRGVVQRASSVQAVLRYIERNPLKAQLVDRAEDWPYGSLFMRNQSEPAIEICPLDMPLPDNWTDMVNQPISLKELKSLRTSLQRSSPFGGPEWAEKTAQNLHLESTLKPLGRPKNKG